MNRRQVLKALATLPVASALGNCSSEQKQPPPPPPPKLHTVEIHLDGAFAVVIQRHKANSILAFSPRDPKEPHEFYMYTPKEPVPLDPRKNYHFKLPAEGLEISERPEIKPGFEDFFAETKSFRLPDSMVVLELPCPQSITFSGHREPAVFLSGKRGWMPANHILKYHTRDAGGKKLLCSELGGECEPSPDSPPGLTRYFFDVGPAQRSDPFGRHAVAFFNFMLAHAFPELQKEYSLRSIGFKQPKGRYGAASLVPAIDLSDGPAPQLLEATYTLDCKGGGFLGAASSGP